MKQTIGLSQFRDAFHNSGRGTQFSYHGLKALFDSIEQYENETGEEVELDVIELCCTYTEYDDEQDCLAHYQDCDDMDELGNKTRVLPVEGGGYLVEDY